MPPISLEAVGGAVWAWLLRPRAALGEARRGC
jgi:hypothetical protein